MEDQFPILKYFTFEHLPFHLQELSRPFHDIAYEMVRLHEANPNSNPAEVAAGLRKLLEAKDCMVRAAV